MLLAAALLGAFVAVSGIGDIEVQAVRAALHRHGLATPHVVIAEVDDATLDRLGAWPLSRRYYAQAIDRLFAAGARGVLINFNFSSAQTPASDAAFAGAIRAHPGRVVLEVVHLVKPAPGLPAVLLPMPLLVRGALLGAAETPYARDDGTILRAPYGDRWDGMTYPGLAAAVAGVRSAPGAFYPIDTAIAPGAIPRIGFAEMLTRPLPAGLVAGRFVFIGAVSERVPDFVRLPGHGRVPSTAMLALAAETLLEGPVTEVSRYAVLVLGVLVAAAGLGWGGRRGAALLAGAAVVAVALQLTLPATVFVTVVPALVVLLAVLAAGWWPRAPRRR